MAPVPAIIRWCQPPSIIKAIRHRQVFGHVTIPKKIRWRGAIVEGNSYAGDSIRAETAPPRQIHTPAQFNRTHHPKRHIASRTTVVGRRGRNSPFSPFHHQFPAHSTHHALYRLLYAAVTSVFLPRHPSEQRHRQEPRRRCHHEISLQ
jgi:hypothetical protein